MFSLPERRIYLIMLSLLFFSYFCLSIIPAQSKMPNQEALLLINLLFLLCSLVFSLVFSRIPVNFIEQKKTRMNYKELLVSTYIFSSLSIFGFLFMFYDRAFVRGISYSTGLRSARYEWLSSSGGSIYSILGNLLVPFGYYCLVLFLVNNSYMNFKQKFVLLSSCFLSVFGHAALNGGRSNLIIGTCLFVVILICMNKKLDWSWVKKSFYPICSFLLLFFIMILYSISIISSSAELGGVSLGDMTYMAISELYGNVTDDFYTIDSNFVYFFYYISAYLFHGSWTSQIALSLDGLDGSYALYPISVVLNQAGIISQPLEAGYFSLYGAFITMPGALYYDFGYFGLIISSSILGAILGLSIRVIKSGKKINGFNFPIIVYVIFIYLLWPILPGYGFSYINFILFSFVLVEVFNRLFFKKSISWF